MVDLQRLRRAAVALLLGLLLGGFSVAAFADYLKIMSVTSSQVAAHDANSHLVGRIYDGGHSAAVYPWLESMYVKHTMCVSIGGVGQKPGPGAPTYGGVPPDNYSEQQYSLSQQYVTCATGTEQNSVSVGFRLQKFAGPVPCDTGQVLSEFGQCEAPPEPECANGSWNQSLQICQCDAGWSVDTGGACTVDKCASDAGQVGRFGTINASSTCSFGCTATRAGVANSACVETQHDANGQPTSWMCDMRITGEHCTSGWSLESPAPETDAGPKDGEKEGCPVGYYEGTVNGEKYCVMTPPVTKEQTTEHNVTTHPDGTSTETSTTRSSEVNPDGSLEQTTTTTTTEKDASGNVTSTSTSSTSSGSGLGAFCAGNPGSQLCQGGGGFSGNCGAKPVCKGDAIQCAIAAATFEMNCALAVGEDVLGEFAAIQEFDGTGEGQGLDRKQIDVPESLVVSEIGGGAGLQDQSFTVMGQTIVIPFSELNRFIEMLGYAIMMIAWIGAWRIIAGAF